MSKDLHKFSQLCATRIVVLVAYLVSQMPFVPLFAAALALSDGGHRVQIEQVAGNTEIVLSHDQQCSHDLHAELAVISEQGARIHSHPDHRIHFAQSGESDLLFQKTSTEKSSPCNVVVDSCHHWHELHQLLLVYQEEWRDLRIRANEKTRFCPEQVQGLASTVMLV